MSNMAAGRGRSDGGTSDCLKSSVHSSAGSLCGNLATTSDHQRRRRPHTDVLYGAVSWLECSLVSLGGFLFISLGTSRKRACCGVHMKCPQGPFTEGPSAAMSRGGAFRKGLGHESSDPSTMTSLQAQATEPPNNGLEPRAKINLPSSELFYSGACYSIKNGPIHYSSPCGSATEWFVGL